MKFLKHLALITFVCYGQSIRAMEEQALIKSMQQFRGIKLMDTYDSDDDGKNIKNIEICNTPDTIRMRGNAITYKSIVVALTSLKRRNPEFYQNYAKIVSDAHPQMNPDFKMKYSDELRPYPCLSTCLGYQLMVGHAIKYNIAE